MGKSSQPSPQKAAARLKQIFGFCPNLAIVLGSGFHHVQTALRVGWKISCIINPAAGIRTGRLSHAEVLKTAGGVRVLAVELLKKLVRFYGKTDTLQRRVVERLPL